MEEEQKRQAGQLEGGGVGEEAPPRAVGGQAGEGNPLRRQPQRVEERQHLPVRQAMRQPWHRPARALLRLLRLREVVITDEARVRGLSRAGTSTPAVPDSRSSHTHAPASLPASCRLVCSMCMLPCTRAVASMSVTHDISTRVRRARPSMVQEPLGLGMGCRSAAPTFWVAGTVMHP